METNDLVIYCFDKWWKATVRLPVYSTVKHPLGIIMPFAVNFYSTTIYNTSTKKFICNRNHTSSAQLELEIWMTPNMPTLDMDVVKFERLRKTYKRLGKV